MTTRWAASLLLNDRAPHQVAMSLVTWVNNRLKPDQARHVAVTLVLAVAMAYLPIPLTEPWMLALAAGVLMALYELVQRATGTGVADWNDVAADMAAAGLVAIATLA